MAIAALSLLGGRAGAARRLTRTEADHFTAPAVSPAMNCRDSAM